MTFSVMWYMRLNSFRGLNKLIPFSILEKYGLVKSYENAYQSCSIAFGKENVVEKFFPHYYANVRTPS